MVSSSRKVLSLSLLSGTTARVICLIPAHALVSCLRHLVTFPFCFLFILSHSTLLLFCPSTSLCFSASSSCFNLSTRHSTVLSSPSRTISLSNVSNLHLPQLWDSITDSISLSVRLLSMGLRFCCEMCGWGERSLFCAEK